MVVAAAAAAAAAAGLVLRWWWPSRKDDVVSFIVLKHERERDRELRMSYYLNESSIVVVCQV